MMGKSRAVPDKKSDQDPTALILSAFAVRPQPPSLHCIYSVLRTVNLDLLSKWSAPVMRQTYCADGMQ